MKFYKYIAIILVALLIGITGISLYTQGKLKDRIIELQEQTPDTTYVEITDTVYFDNPTIKWKTIHDTTEFFTRDTFYANDTVVIVKEKILHPDTFYVDEEYFDDTISADIYISGRGIFENTYIDSVRMNYKINTEVLVPKKKCNFWRKIFCGCE